MYLYHHGLVGVCLLFWVVIQFCVIYFSAQIVIPLAIGSYFRLVCVLCSRCPIFCVSLVEVLHFIPGLQDAADPRCTLPPSAGELARSARSLPSSTGETQCKPRSECVFATECYCFWPFSAERTRK